ncbi:unnamed protein product [Nezara viridula]|uniref:C2H2-type domain-containing protein n=1 Tax=Nezara viridula TaxID=85310 RepID=A0A9P0E9F1_NEZVI|nr:unnamed protein product [Nezara viridula]
MASALLHMSCPSLKHDIIGMESHSFRETLQGLEGAKRDHDLEDLDRSQVKKRRKQSKPNRITSTELFSEVDIKSSVWVTLQQNQPLIPLKETDKIRNYDISFCNVAKENKVEQKHDSEAEESSEDNCSGMYSSNKKKDFSFPLNLSHKTPSPQDSVDSFSSTIEERSWYKNSDNSNLPGPSTIKYPKEFQSGKETAEHAIEEDKPTVKKEENESQDTDSPHDALKNGAHIGGVVCDICNKELCSKYFLRVHKQNSHGIVEEAFLPQIGSEIKVPMANADIALRPNDNELNHRYFSHFTEVCTICNRRFRSAKWLRAHLLNDHGEEGKDKWKEVQLQNVLALLLVHERTHLPIITDMQDIRCPVCAVCFDNSESLDKHLTLKHSLPMFPFKKNPEESGNFNENPHAFQCEEMENKAGLNKDDNNYEEINDSKFDASPQADACLKCNRCSYMTHHIELYSEHIKNEHKLDEPQMDYLQIIRDALLQIANNSHIPASFAVPNNLGNFMMQPFVLEDKAFGANSPSTFLSSLVFLPVKERLDKPITASFKLTPT